jgi:hypothetical protein
MSALVVNKRSPASRATDLAFSVCAAVVGVVVLTPDVPFALKSLSTLIVTAFERVSNFRIFFFHSEGIGLSYTTVFFIIVVAPVAIKFNPAV